MNVPFLDLKASYLELKDELDAAYYRTTESGGTYSAKKLKLSKRSLPPIADKVLYRGR
jgi:hypothetical protein